MEEMSRIIWWIEGGGEGLHRLHFSNRLGNIPFPAPFNECNAFDEPCYQPRYRDRLALDGPLSKLLSNKTRSGAAQWASTHCKATYTRRNYTLAPERVSYTRAIPKKRYHTDDAVGSRSEITPLTKMYIYIYIRIVVLSVDKVLSTEKSNFRKESRKFEFLAWNIVTIE